MTDFKITDVKVIHETCSFTETNILLKSGWKLLFVGMWAERVGHPDGSFQQSDLAYVLGALEKRDPKADLDEALAETEANTESIR